MQVQVFEGAAQATHAAADRLIEELRKPETRNVMLAGGNTPLKLYGEVASRRPRIHHVNIYALDEYVGVPTDDPRNCANLLRRTVVEAWGIAGAQYYCLSSSETKAAESIIEHEQTILDYGGLDLAVLGLGQNAHIGFNEPGGEIDSIGRVLALSAISVEANRQWFGGEYAPDQGVTTGMKTILSARVILLLAFGAHKAGAVAGMLEGPQTPSCPASYLGSRPNVLVFLDSRAAGRLANASIACASPEAKAD